MKKLLSAVSALSLVACAAGASAVTASPADAAGKPLALQVSSATITEGQFALLKISKTGGNGKPVTVTWSADNGASGKVILSGSTPASVGIAVADDKIVNGTRMIMVKALAAESTGATGSGMVTVLDNDVAPAAPVETPTDNPMTGQSLGLGAPDIPTIDHDVMADLQPAWGNGAIPASGKPDVVGAFRFICGHSSLAFDDPTVFHDQPGKSHLHDQTGVANWNAYSNYANLRVKGAGSQCNNVSGQDHNPAELTWAANRTPYWQPALLDGKGNAILADYTSFYYKRRPISDPIVSDPTNPQYQGKAVDLPNGLKFLFGGDPTTGAVTNFGFQCTNGAGGVVYEGDESFAAAVACATAHSDGTLEVHQTAPDCWDGVHLDTPDHRSHLAYGSYGSWGYYKCDAAHPFVIPAFTYAAFYTILPTDMGDIHFSSDEMDNSKPRGWSFHVDYGPAAWDPRVLRMWTEGCINQLLNCSGGDLGNGLQLKGASVPIYYSNGTWTPLWRNPTRLVPIASVPATPVR